MKRHCDQEVQFTLSSDSMVKLGSKVPLKLSSFFIIALGSTAIKIKVRRYKLGL